MPKALEISAQSTRPVFDLGTMDRTQEIANEASQPKLNNDMRE
jgi:hypothetical protein